MISHRASQTSNTSMGIHMNEVTGAWRLSFRFRRHDDDKPVEIRAFLKNDQATLTETWSYLLAP